MPARIRVTTLTILSLLFATATAADDDPVDATDPARIVAIIQDLGYRARLETDNIGDPLIVSSVTGTEFSMQFYGCDEDSHDGCTLILFSAGWDFEDGVDASAIAEWNRDTVVSRAYLDDENDPWLEWAVNLFGGVTRTNFEDTFDWWEVVVGQFESHLQ